MKNTEHLVEGDATSLETQKANNPTFQRCIDELNHNELNTEHRIAFKIVKYQKINHFMMLVTGGTETGKINVIEYINRRNDKGELLQMGTMGTADFGIGGT